MHHNEQFSAEHCRADLLTMWHKNCHDVVRRKPLGKHAEQKKRYEKNEARMARTDSHVLITGKANEKCISHMLTAALHSSSRICETRSRH